MARGTPEHRGQPQLDLLDHRGRLFPFRLGRGAPAELPTNAERNSLDTFLQQGIELANAEIGTVADLHRYLDTRTWLWDRVDSRDPGRLTPFAGELGDIINASASGDEAAVVQRLNRLVAAHPLWPRISGHDASTWHLHVNDLDDTVSEVLIGEALLGLVLLVTELSATGFGRCAAEGCEHAFLDTTTNRSRRFCSTCCATRTNVAEYRRRKRASAGEPARVGMAPSGTG